MVGQSGQAGRCFAGQGILRWVEQVGERALPGTSDTSSDLVGLSQPELVRTLDDQGVGCRNVDSGLDDRRGDEAVGLTAHEGQHRLLKNPFVHLAVGDRDPEPGDQCPQPLGGVVE